MSPTIFESSQTELPAADRPAADFLPLGFARSRRVSFADGFIQGEFSRTLDERYRLALPAELTAALGAVDGRCVVVKERAGCLSLWEAAAWKRRLDSGLDLIQAKLKAGKFAERSAEMQMLGRLLSTRHADVQLGDRGRLLVPEGFREFLKVEAGGEVMLVGAAVCVEIWQPAAWIAYLERRMPSFRKLFAKLSD
mgnify:FL=1